LTPHKTDEGPGLRREKVRPGTGREAGLGHDDAYCNLYVGFGHATALQCKCSARVGFFSRPGGIFSCRGVFL